MRLSPLPPGCTVSAIERATCDMDERDAEYARAMEALDLPEEPDTAAFDARPLYDAEVSNVRRDEDGITARLDLYSVAGWAHVVAEVESTERGDFSIVSLRGGAYLGELGTLIPDERAEIEGDEGFRAAVGGEVERLWVA